MRDKNDLHKFKDVYYRDDNGKLWELVSESPVWARGSSFPYIDHWVLRLENLFDRSDFREIRPSRDGDVPNYTLISAMEVIARSAQ